ICGGENAGVKQKSSDQQFKLAKKCSGEFQARPVCMGASRILHDNSLFRRYNMLPVTGLQVMNF
ncbi:hypothetical protein, partial [Victivallis lenta]|uniref:hypothetical protein n=1 Tax=Victivallis lenta TaxID=2606640 RepID=UPI003AB749A8